MVVKLEKKREKLLPNANHVNKMKQKNIQIFQLKVPPTTESQQNRSLAIILNNSEILTFMPRRFSLTPSLIGEFQHLTFNKWQYYVFEHLERRNFSTIKPLKKFLSETGLNKRE